jgi:gas vesicle protein
MAQNLDHSSSSTGPSGLAFGLGLLTGAALGVGLGLLFAPREGAALRRDIGRRAHDLRDQAGERLDHATEAADELLDRGRDLAQRARTAVATGIREARRHGAGVAADIADAMNDARV